MTFTTEAAPPEPDTPAMTSACAYCSSPLADDQEWCLECGAAQTLIHRPPDWRIPVAIIATVVTLALIALAIALVNLSATANQAAATLTITAASQPNAPAATQTQPATSAPSTFSGWPVGLSGWTVALTRTRSQALADAAATRLAADGVKVGVLDSSQHPSMPAGYWFVFSGRYPDRTRAIAAAATLRLEGQASAVAVRVARPGGL